MNKLSSNRITPNQLTLILIGSIIGIQFITLPNLVTSFAKQDGWISVIIGGIYPLYTILICNYIASEYPYNNIFELSKQYLGRKIGIVCNLIFTCYFLLLTTEIMAGIANIIVIYITPFLKTTQVLLCIALVPCFIAYSGISTLGRMNQTIFYFTIPLFFIPLIAIKDGTILNIMPILQSSPLNILKSSFNTFSAYSGVEFLFLLYPFLTKKDSLKHSSLTAVIFTILLFSSTTFLTIYYLGIDVIPKFLWSVVTVTESIDIPVINSFRYIFMVLFIIILFKSISNLYYAFSFGLNQFFPYKVKSLVSLLCYPLVCFLSTFFGSPVERKTIAIFSIPIYIIFNLIFITVLAILIHRKKGVKNDIS